MERKPLKIKKEPVWKRLLKNVALTLGIGVGVSSCGGVSDKAENLSSDELKMKKHSLQMKQNKNAMEIFELGSLDAKIKVQEFDEATKSILVNNAKDYIKKADEYLKKGADLGYYTDAVKALLPQGNYLILAEDGNKPETFVQSAQGRVQVGDNKFKSFTTDKMNPNEISYVMNMVATQYDLNSTEGRKYVETIAAIRAIELAQDKALDVVQNKSNTSESEKAYLAAYRYIHESGSGRSQILEIVEKDAPIVESPMIKIKSPQKNSKIAQNAER